MLSTERNKSAKKSKDSDIFCPTLETVIIVFDFRQGTHERVAGSKGSTIVFLAPFSSVVGMR